MGRWLRFFLDLCFLKAAPQDAPSSKVAMYFAVISYFVAGTGLTMLSRPFLQAVLIATVQTVLFLFLTNLALWIRRLPDRINQAITALTGTGVVIALVAAPLLAWLADPQVAAQTAVMVLWLALVVWETLVVGNILRHALDVPLAAGIGVALVFLYMSFAVTVRFLKVLTISPG